MDTEVNFVNASMPLSHTLLSILLTSSAPTFVNRSPTHIASKGLHPQTRVDYEWTQGTQRCQARTKPGASSWRASYPAFRRDLHSTSFQHRFQGDRLFRGFHTGDQVKESRSNLPQSWRLGWTPTASVPASFSSFCLLSSFRSFSFTAPERLHYLYQNKSDKLAWDSLTTRGLDRMGARQNGVWGTALVAIASFSFFCWRLAWQDQTKML